MTAARPRRARRLRVALACDWFLPRLGGIEGHLRDLALRLNEAGLVAEVVTTTPGPAVMDGVRVHRVHTVLFPRFGFPCTPHVVHALRRVMGRERFDLVHAHASIVSPTAYVAAVVARTMATPAIVTFHSVLRNHALWLRPLLRAGGIPALDATFTAVSAGVAREARTLLGGRNVDVVPNGIDAGYWQRQQRPRADARVHLVSVMRLTPKKRPHALLEIMAKLRRMTPDIALHMTIVGDGVELPAMRRRLRALELTDIVELTGRLERDRIARLFAESDVFVLPTVLESFGIAALEARAAGLPVVVRRESGVADLLVDGVDGLLAASDEDLLDCLRRLVTDEILRAKIAEHNRRVPAPAAWDDVLARHTALYESVLR